MTASFARILVGSDFSDSASAALQVAAALAHRTGAALDLVHVLADPPQSVTGFVPLDALLLRAPEIERTREQARARLEELAKSVAPVPVEIHLREGNAAVEILALRALLSVDLVALGASGMRGLRRFVLGSVADRVLRRPGCPLLLVNTAPPTGELKTIVVGQEYPDRSTAWLELALHIAHDERGEVIVVHVPPARGYLSDAHHVDVEPEKAGSKLERIVRELDRTVPVRIDIARGDPAQKLTESAHEVRADLVIVGAERNQDGWPGRVTNQLAREGLPALLIVWPDDESDEDFASDAT